MYISPIFFFFLSILQHEVAMKLYVVVCYCNTRKHCPHVILCTALFRERLWEILTCPNVATEKMRMAFFPRSSAPSPP